MKRFENLSKFCFCKKDSVWCGTFERHAAWTLLGFFSGAVVFAWLSGLSETTIDVLKVITGGLIAVSAGIAAQQFRFNRKQAEKANKWNTKQLAATQMHASRKVMKDAISRLHGYLEVVEQKEPFKLYEIHDAFGVMLDNGEFVFHGEHDDKCIKHIPDEQSEQDNYRATSFNKEYNGREVKDAIIDYLSEYEYICSAINNDIFDDKTVKSLLRGSIINAYYLFSDYIEHQRESTGNPTYFAEFVSVATRYKAE